MTHHTKKPSHAELESRIQALLKERAKLEAQVTPEPVPDPTEDRLAAIVDEINALRHAQAHPLPHTADQGVELMAPASVEEGADAHPDKVIVEVPEAKGTHLPEQQTVDAVAQRNAEIEDKKRDSEKVEAQKRKPEVDVTKDLTPPKKDPKAVEHPPELAPGKKANPPVVKK